MRRFRGTPCVLRLYGHEIIGASRKARRYPLCMAMIVFPVCFPQLRGGGEKEKNPPKFKFFFPAPAAPRSGLPASRGIGGVAERAPKKANAYSHRFQSRPHGRTRVLFDRCLLFDRKSREQAADMIHIGFCNHIKGETAGHSLRRLDHSAAAVPRINTVSVRPTLDLPDPEQGQWITTPFIARAIPTFRCF